MRTSTTSLLSFSIIAASLLAFAGMRPSALAVGEYACPSVGADDSVVIGSSCYVYFSATKSWSDAKAACASLGGTLAIIRGASENTAVHSIRGGTEPWIGASDNGSLISGASEGNYHWIGDASAFWEGGQSGSAVGGAYTNWHGGEPNNASSIEHCLHMYASNRWNDLNCENEQSYVCQLVATRDGESSSSAQGGGGGVRTTTLQNLIDASLQRRGGSATTHPAAGGASSSSHMSASQARICERVLRNFTHNPSMLAKVNARLKKALGFTCGR